LKPPAKVCERFSSSFFLEVYSDGEACSKAPRLRGFRPLGEKETRRSWKEKQWVEQACFGDGTMPD